jgi:hypothetical protein
MGSNRAHLRSAPVCFFRILLFLSLAALLDQLTRDIDDDLGLFAALL